MTLLAPEEQAHLRGGTGTPAISVVVCTYHERRFGELTAACASVSAQLAPHDELIVVVDHNPELLSRVDREIPGVHAVASAGPRGLSGARNTGVRLSHCPVVAFLDDDATAADGWLDRVRAAFADPAVQVVGTEVAPRWAGGSPPRWFPPEFGWVVGCGYRGLPTAPAPVRNPIGASMAIRRACFAEVGGFSEVVGRVGTLPVGCEETEFCIRLTRRHTRAAVVFDPRARVDHLVPADRQRLRYFLSRCYHEGRSKRAVAALAGAGDALAAERRYVRVVLPLGVARGLAGAVRRPHGLLQAGAILAGLTATVLGYLTGAPARTGKRRNHT
ncbi:glycosyltransferase family 2 protein [Catenuloplanes atrovinosus]|uniref:GT2 family glycosyltransferase n=1 Tax=Catenuloplanes atrovinosus TaxID=137266 RepID=A0AAE3YSW4_9ACTN|nr:glycosyltransferase family 2 protein [Catenuloplanes atrovinosus]MDR7279050.1 GT2 family glycosyltransferase [Catenuloplanes atrovinosus]